MNDYESLLNNLSNLQNSNGSFSRSTIPYTSDYESVYYTALILITIEKLPFSPTKKLITQKGIAFLKQEMGVSYTWNYMPLNSSSNYPDDLDDTFLAITAISIYDKAYLTYEFLVSITNLLIAQETKPGGPYRTWVTSLDNWNNVDIVINTNIYRFLAAQGIILPQLENYFKEKITCLDFTSEYYHRTIVVIYFLSDCLPVVLKEELAKTIGSHPELLQPENNLEQHLLVILLRNLGQHLIKNSSVQTCISQSNTNPFFIERATNREVTYSTCTAFELAILLRIHTLTTNTPQAERLEDDTQSILEKSLSLLEKVLSDRPLLKEKLLSALDKLISTHSEKELLLPYIFYNNLHEKYKDVITHETIYTLCLSTLLGWIGFTIQDQIIDQESSVDQFPLVTTSVLICQDLVQSTLFGSSDISIIQNLFHDINESLLEEITYHTHLVKDDCIDLIHLSRKVIPITQCSKKSLGIALGPIAIILLLPITHSYHHVRLIKNYFSSLLTIKQVLDDMHDWHSDLQRGYINPVAARIINLYRKDSDYTTLNVLSEKNTLYNLFWKNTFEELYQELVVIIQQAQTAVLQFTFLEKTDFLIEPLNHYLQVLNHAREEKIRGELFLHHYKKTTSQ